MRRLHSSSLMSETYCFIRAKTGGLFQLCLCVRLDVLQPAYAILWPLAKQTLVSLRYSLKQVRESLAGPVGGPYCPNRRKIPSLFCCYHCFMKEGKLGLTGRLNIFNFHFSNVPFFFNILFLVGGEMSLCGAADGPLLVHGGSSSGCHCNAPSLPFPHFGDSSIQESMHSVLPGDKLSLPQRSFDGVVHRGVGPASANSPEGAQCCWAAAGKVSRLYCVGLTKKNKKRRFKQVCKTFPCRLILGMMLTTSFLSMWLSNTATTAMMLPIANAILESLFGDLESLKEKCKSPNDPEHDALKGSEQMILHTTVYFLFTHSFQNVFQGGFCFLSTQV